MIFTNLKIMSCFRTFHRGFSSFFKIPSSVKIVEVGPRDGLQNEKTIIDCSTKVELINRLSLCGFRVIEVTSFVSPKWVPQMADNQLVYEQINKLPNTNYPVLVPNLDGMKRAIDCGAKEVAVFTAASNTFSIKNTNCNIEESFKRIEAIAKVANDNSIKLRGYLSCVFGCPYEGKTDQQKVADLSARLNEIGCYEISLGDTIGIGDPASVNSLLNKVLQVVPAKSIAIHCHDTYGMALANIVVALQNGIATFDSSVGGLGGCPYAPGASGNVASEDLVYMFHRMGVQTGIDLDLLLETSSFINSLLKRNPSKLSQVLQVKRLKNS